LFFERSDGWQEYTAMIADAKTKTTLSERFEGLAAAESYAINEGLLIPYRATGGNFAINNIQNPYETTSSVPYGGSSYLFIDRIYGTSPITAAKRAELKAAFEAEVAALRAQ
jgi:hypothetical protein